MLPFPVQQLAPDEIRRADWLALMRREWHQGEHVAIAGRTGRGKTWLARDLLAIRQWSIVLAVKRDDDTLETFQPMGYRKISRWPPNWDMQHVLYWPRPEDLDDVPAQAVKVKRVLNDVYQNGGWALLLDDLAYVCNTLGFAKYVSIMFNQARSSHISMVTAFTQPSSITQRVPSEAWRQVRFYLSFYYRTGRDRDVTADITGYSRSEINALMARLRPHDFLAFDDATDSVRIVRAA